jgi:hypothetical protein
MLLLLLPQLHVLSHNSKVECCTLTTMAVQEWALIRTWGMLAWRD